LPRSVAVDADLVGGQLVLTVTNSGHWVEPATEATGSGLANLKRRLELLNIAFTLDVEADEQQVAVRLRLPARRAVTETASELAPQAAAAGASSPGTVAEVADA
jgi:LytS/YehU family sensor histidine kinase